MKIAQIAPLHESVPPNGYGGAERIVHYLTEELVDQGHEVTLFASGDSNTRAELEAVVPRSLRNDTRVLDPVAHHTLLLERVSRRAAEFDILHFHLDYVHFPLMRQMRHPHITTQHNFVNHSDLQPLFSEFGDLPQVAISNHQRGGLPLANWIGTVHNAIPRNLLTPDERGGEDLVFVGRICPDKRPDRAIMIARACGRPLKIAAKLDNGLREYFDAVIEPLIRQTPNVEFLGEVDDREKNRLLAGAHALLFPIEWPEPFGMVMIEAMACGTPVVAWPQGAVPEVIENGRTGFVVDTIEAAVDAVSRTENLSRSECRRAFEERFTAERMAKEYLDAYERVLSGRGPVLLMNTRAATPVCTM